MFQHLLCSNSEENPSSPFSIFTLFSTQNHRLHLLGAPQRYAKRRLLDSNKPSPINLMTFDEVANPPSRSPGNYFCSRCSAISFSCISTNTDGNLCTDCLESTEGNEVDQQIRIEENDESIPPNEATATTVWDALTKYDRIQKMPKKDKPFRGQYRYSNRYNRMLSHSRSHFTKQHCVIELECRHLVEESTVDDRIITFAEPLFGYTLGELTQHLENDLEAMKRFPTTAPPHGLGEVNQMNQLLREVASSLRGEPLANWRMNSSNRFVRNHLAECLDRIADGDEVEFPWVDEPTQGTIFPSIDELRADMADVRDELDGPNHNAVINILLRLEPGSNCFASESTEDGNWGPPYRYTGSKLQCPSKLCAIHTVESFYHGYQALDGFSDFIPAEYRDNPDALPFEMKQEAIKQFYQSMDITFVPCFLKPMDNFSVDATDEEVEALQVAINPLLDAENSRINRELRVLEDHVSVCNLTMFAAFCSCGCSI